MVAIKYNDDVYYDNEFYSKVGGLSCRELNQLEGAVLSSLDFDLYVSSEHYERYLDCLWGNASQPMDDIASKESSKLGLVAVSSEASMKTVPSSNDLSREEGH